MKEIFFKEIRGFFSSLIGYLVIGLFIIILGLMMWVFPDSSLLEYNFASLDQLFYLAPIIFLFLIPAITMRSLSEEMSQGTIEILITKPFTETDIVLGKFFACVTLVIIALVPTLIYYISIYRLGSPVGNIDTGSVFGSYIGLLFLAGAFVSIGLFSSSLTKNQIVSFLFSIFLSYLFFYAFFMLSKLPIFFGKTDDIIQQIGLEDHYTKMSRGVVDTRELIYFLTFIGFFLWMTIQQLKSRKF
ncbi:MAG: gliding motility-associated ABC transporter permease subunit GldF [Saprospiraceae bacterium]|nr:gliding motility-associated ABC transporter permease subunit GldF [Saprospiraceae bacterium]